MANPSNFDSLIFVEQVGIQNIVRIIVKPSICFGGIGKKAGKKQRYYPVTIPPFIPERHRFTAEPFAALHTPQKLFTRTRNLCQADLWNPEDFFSCKNHSIFRMGGGWKVALNNLCVPALQVLSIKPDRIYGRTAQPRKGLECSTGNEITTNEPRDTQRSQERTQKVLQRVTGWGGTALRWRRGDFD